MTVAQVFDLEDQIKAKAKAKAGDDTPDTAKAAPLYPQKCLELVCSTERIEYSSSLLAPVNSGIGFNIRDADQPALVALFRPQIDGSRQQSKMQQSEDWQFRPHEVSASPSHDTRMGDWAGSALSQPQRQAGPCPGPGTGHVQRLREAIDADGRSDSAISTAAGFTRSYVSHIFNQGADPSVESLLKLCATLDVSPAYILTGAQVTPEGERLLKAWPKLAEIRRHAL
jgi:hypothetical protein